MRRLDRRTVIGVLGAVLAVAVACSVWFGMRAAQLREGESGGNLALADPGATEEVVARVSAGLKAAFSYDYSNLARTERAAKLALTGQAATEYRSRFAEVTKRAQAGRLIRSSSVRSIGVRELTGERATLLVFLDQQTLRGKSGAPSSATATLDVTAVRVNGAWRISQITTL